MYDATVKIELFTDGLSYNEFVDNDWVADAVNKNILVIGEATKNIPIPFRDAHPQIEWRKFKNSFHHDDKNDIAQ